MMRPLTLDDLEAMTRQAMAADDWATVANLEPRLDMLDRPRPMLNPVSAALWYASAGLRVFPLQPRQKIPHRGTRGCKDATSDPTQITAWWQRWPGSNIGIATGHLVDVIDVDGPLGVQAWARMDNLPPILGVVNTPRPGGTHLYIAPIGLGNRAKIVPGLDYRGAGGYVLAPPSYVVETEKGYEGPYTWRRPPVLAVEARAA